MTISRRKVLKAGLVGGGMAMLPFGLMKNAWAAPGKTLTRYNVLSQEGQKMLAIYADAVKKMMAKDPKDPLSWTFQWYTHAMPGDRPKAQTIDKLYGSGSSPNKALAQAMWWTCEPHASHGVNSNAFLPWHRMYVLYFEQIIRTVSGRPDFTLPYWDYTGPYSASGNNYSVMPKQFLLEKDPVWAPLYRPDRNPGSNAGKPVVDAGNPLDLSCMKWPNYADKGTVAGFCSNINGNPHGALHGDVGNQKGMGQVPWAANDPIFWLHHANIDRIWASWNKSGGKNPNDSAFLNETWVFADGAGKAVKVKVSEILDTTTLAYPYVYAEYAERPKDSLPFPSAQKNFQLRAESVAPGATAKAIALGGKATSVALQVPVAANALKQSFGAQLKALPASSVYALSFDAIEANGEPGNNYLVYLGLPAGAAPTPEYLVGGISMFGVGMQGMHGGHHASSTRVSFLVGERIHTLLAAGGLEAAPTVTLVPLGEPNPGTEPTIGSITLQSLAV
ncbi:MULTISPECIES: tyrosinase family protein [Pseudomonas]|jgi:tyrosinase|uniref:Tyrosinase family protein n=1 Tax=Pseudomonas gingeri TaxID=117681 RepID=A0A7Y8BLA6_9PSED|nr:tyrosinase family protein [Pseudomonas gingeri]MBV6748694.1 tyrosinase family protein [Pseudomonas chlororaphis]NWB47940.1 tyrosinase family protein [Pseudomonas gingeri]